MQIKTTLAFPTYFARPLALRIPVRFCSFFKWNDRQIKSHPEERPFESGYVFDDCTLACVRQRASKSASPTAPVPPWDDSCVAFFFLLLLPFFPSLQTIFDNLSFTWRFSRNLLGSVFEVIELRNGGGKNKNSFGGMLEMIVG